MDPSRGGYQGYSQPSTSYPSSTSAYSTQPAQTSYSAQSSATGYYNQQSYQDSSASRGQYYQTPNQTPSQTYPMRQHPGYDASSSYQYPDYSSTQSSGYSAAQRPTSTYRKRPRDESTRFDEPRPKRQDTRPERAGPSQRAQASPATNRWSTRGARGGARGGSRGSSMRGRGRGRGERDDRSRPSYFSSASSVGNGRGARVARGRGRGRPSRDPPTPSTYSRDTRDYYDARSFKPSYDSKQPPPPAARRQRSPLRTSPRPFPARQPESGRHSSHRRSRTASKSPSLRPKEDVTKLLPRSVMFASGAPGEVDEHRLLSGFFSNHPGLHLAPQLQVGTEDFLFKVSLMETSKRKIRKREPPVAEAEIYKRDIIVCALISDGDFSNPWLPESAFVKLDTPETKENDDADVTMIGATETATEAKDDAANEVDLSPPAESVSADAPVEASDVAVEAPVPVEAENKTTDPVIVDNGAAEPVSMETNKPQNVEGMDIDADAEAPVQESSSNNVETADSNSANAAPAGGVSSSTVLPNGEQQSSEQQVAPAESEPNEETAPSTVDEQQPADAVAMDVDAAPVAEEKSDAVAMDVDGEEDQKAPAVDGGGGVPAVPVEKKLTNLTVVFGIDHALRADSDSKSNHDFLSLDTLEHTRVVVAEFGPDPNFGDDTVGVFSSAEEAKIIFERLLTTGPLKKQSFRGLQAWDLDPANPHSFQSLFPALYQAQTEFFRQEEENNKMDKLRESNSKLKSENSSLKKQLESAKSKISKFEKAADDAMSVLKKLKK